MPEPTLRDDDGVIEIHAAGLNLLIPRPGWRVQAQPRASRRSEANLSARHAGRRIQGQGCRYPTGPGVSGRVAELDYPPEQRRCARMLGSAPSAQTPRMGEECWRIPIAVNAQPWCVARTKQTGESLVFALALGHGMRRKLHQVERPAERVGFFSARDKLTRSSDAVTHEHRPIGSSHDGEQRCSAGASISNTLGFPNWDGSTLHER